MVIPLTIPGMDRGSVTLKNTAADPAPRSCAASRRLSSSWRSVVYSGRIIKGR